MPRHFIGGDVGVAAGAAATTPDAASLWAVVDLVDAVDLSIFEDAYRADGSGGQPYDPRLMVVAIVWCAQLGWRSPSQVARACRNQVLLREWFGARVPGLSTVRRFIVNHRGAWRRLFPQVLAVGDRVGLVDASLTATDGTPLASAGSLRGVVELWRVRAEIRDGQEALAALAADNARVAAALDRGAAGSVGAFVDQVCGQAMVQERRLRRRLGRLTAAEQVATGRALAEQRVDPVELAARLERQRATLARMVAEQEAKCARHAATVAVYPHGAGRAPTPVARYAAIARQRRLVEGTQKNCSMPNSVG